MTERPSTATLAQALAEEEDWLAESPERCQVCGHRECFHRLDYSDDTYEVCLVGDCTCDGTTIVAPPVSGTYGETVFASGQVEAKPIAVADLFGGAKPDRVPGVEFEVVFGDDTKEST